MSKAEGIHGGVSGVRPDPSRQVDRAKWDEALTAAGIEKTKPTEPKPQDSGGTPPPPVPTPPR